MLIDRAVGSTQNDPLLEADPLVAVLALTLHQPTTAFTDHWVKYRVGSAGTISGSTSTPDQGTTDAVGAKLSGDGNDQERRVAGVDPPVTDVAAANDDNTAQTPPQPFAIPPHNQVNSSVGNAETDPGSSPEPNHATTDTVGANPSDDGNDLERRSSGVDPLVTDVTAADSDDAAQTPREPLTVPLKDQVNSSVVDAQTPPQPLTDPLTDQVNRSVDAATNPDNTPSPSSSRQAAIDGVGANRDASSSKNTPVSGPPGFWKSLVGFWTSPVKSTDERFFTPCHTEDEIIDMAAREYDLEALKKSLTMDVYNQRIDQWKAMEDRIVRQEGFISIPEPLDYGPEWRVFYALQLWYYYALNGRGKGDFPPGYRTLFDSSEKEILRRSSPTRGLWTGWW